nr:N-acetylmuramoyl-L-alanine amidase [bacterium]
MSTPLLKTHLAYFYKTRVGIGISTALLVACVALITHLTVTAWLHPSTPLHGTTILIDAGHGGQDGGCTGPGGITEGELTLDIALKTGALLEQAGCTIIYTRTDDNGLVAPDGSWSKQSDMHARGEIIKNSGADIVLSLHMNSFPTRQSGAQVFIQQPEREGARQLAEALQQTIRESLMPANKRLVKSGDYYVLRMAPGLGVLVECGFLSNPEEAIMLSDPTWQDKMALAICTGLTRYLATIAPESPPHSAFQSIY